jgi:hypothetical protein
VDALLVAGGAALAALALAHSVLGERYVLRRLFRRALPPLFGSDDFTRRTLRFAWHVVSVAWWGMATLMLLLARAPLDAGGRLALLAVAGTLAATALVTLVVSQGRHWSWVVELGVAVAAAVPALG